MASIQEFLSMSRTKPANTGSAPPPGVYQSVVRAVEIDPRYADETILVTYELKGEKKTYSHSERFVKNPRFARSRSFFEYLEKNSIKNEADFVGCNEELDLRWNFSNSGKRELTIFKRTFLGLPSAGNNTGSSSEREGDA